MEFDFNRLLNKVLLSKINLKEVFGTWPFLQIIVEGEILPDFAPNIFEFFKLKHILGDSLKFLVFRIAFVVQNRDAVCKVEGKTFYFIINEDDVFDLSIWEENFEVLNIGSAVIRQHTILPWKKVVKEGFLLFEELNYFLSVFLAAGCESY